MIIFGTRGVAKSLAGGSFHCPTCGDGSPYKHKRMRRFFTLYFIPVIPLNQLGEYVECQRCKGTYHLEVLQHQPEAEAAAIEAHFQSGARRIMIYMLLADGVIDDSEVTMIQAIYSQIAGRPIAEEALRAEIAQMQTAGTPLNQLLAEMRGYLNPEGVEMVIRAAYQVAMADNEFHESERKLLREISVGLGMMPAHFAGLLAELTGQSDQTPPSLPS